MVIEMNGGCSTEVVLQQIEKFAVVDSNVLAAVLEVDHQEVVGSIKSLQCYDALINVEERNNKNWEVTAEGHTVCFYK